MVAIDGASDINRDKAFEVCPFARFSRKRPRVMNVISILLVSKIVLGRVWGGMKMETSMAAMLKKKAAEVPRTTKTSIVGEPCFIDLYAEI
jgi:hypothetical protein